MDIFAVILITVLIFAVIGCFMYGLALIIRNVRRHFNAGGDRK